MHTLFSEVFTLLFSFFFFLMKLYYNTDTLRTILKQVYYKKPKNKNKNKNKKIILHTILLLAPLLILRKLTLHIITYTTTVRLHTYTTHALILGQGIVFSRLRLLLLQYYWHYMSQSCYRNDNNLK